MAQLPPGFVLDSQPAPGAAQDPVIAVDPFKQQDQARENAKFDLQQQQFQMQQQQHAMKLAEEQRETDAKASKVADSQASATRELRGVLDKINQVEQQALGGWADTGRAGAFVRSMPDFVSAGSDAYDLAKNITTIDAAAAFNALAEMRANSPTGGALGNVTEKELDLLKSSVANLDPNQSEEQFLQNLGEARQRYISMLERIDPEAAAEYARANEGATGAPAAVEDQGLVGSVSYEGPATPPNDGGGSGGGLGAGFAAGIGDLLQAGGDMIGIVSNPLNATVNAVTGSNLTTDMGSYLREQSGLPQGNEIASAINRGGAGALMFGGGAGAARALTTPGLTQNALAMFGRAPLADAAAGAGAGLGMETARQADLGPGWQAGAALAGGLAGNTGVNALATLAQPRTATPLAQAAARQGVDLLPADMGGSGAKILTSGAKASPLSAGPIRTQARQGVEQVRSAAQRTAESQGTVATTDRAGESVRTAAKEYSKRTAQRGERMYDAAYKAAGNVKTIKPVKTVQALDEAITRARQNPADSGLANELESFREKIAGGVSIQGLRDARTSLSQGIYNGQLRGSADQAIYKQVLGNVADDIDAGLRSVGKDEAAARFRAADTFWKERVEHIDQVLQPIIGKDGAKGGEQVVDALESMARGKSGGSARLSRLLAEMKPEEAGNIRATIIDRMGKASAGQQDAAGEAFSASTFLTNWNKMTPQAKASLFSDTGLRKNLNDIATIAENMKATQGMSNFSNTAMAVAGGGQSAGAIAVGAAFHPLIAATIGGTQYLTGKLLASPAFGRWLAKAPKTQNPRAIRKYTEQLGVIAGREPLVANDARALQDYLMRSFGQSPATRAAASEEEQPVRREPPSR